MAREQIKFKAYFPPIASAILVSGNQDGMQVKLAIPESEMANAIAVQCWRGRGLIVTVELDDEHEAGQTSGTEAKAKARKSGRREWLAK